MSKFSFNSLRFRKAVHEDVPKMKSLYCDTVMTICAADYSPVQIQAWAGTSEQTDSLAKRIGLQYFIVAENEAGKIVGFASLQEPDYLDLLYVHKDFQRQGIGNALLSKMLERAIEIGTVRITSDVSITARPFFEENGFQTLREQTVRLGDVELTNYKMEKTLVKIEVTKNSTKESVRKHYKFGE